MPQLQMPYRPYPLSPDDDEDSQDQVVIPPPQAQPPPPPLPPPPQIQPSPPQPPPAMISRQPQMPPPPNYPQAQQLPSRPYLEDRAAQAVQDSPPNLPGPPPSQPLPPGIQPPGPLPGGPTNSGGLAPPPAQPAISPELAHYQALAAQMPTRPKPGILERIVAGAAGGAQGFLASSAAPATRQAAQGLQGIPEKIKLGEYPEQMQDWQTRMAVAAQAAGMARQAENAASQDQLRRAQIEYYGQRPGIAANELAGKNTRAANSLQFKRDQLEANAKKDLVPVASDGAFAKLLTKWGVEPKDLDPDTGAAMYSKQVIGMLGKTLDHADYQKFLMAKQQDLLASKWDIAEMQQNRQDTRQGRSIAIRKQIADENRIARSTNPTDKDEAARIRATNTYKSDETRINTGMRKEMMALDKQYKIGDPLGAPTPDKLPPEQQVRYWNSVIQIETGARQAKQAAAGAHARAFGEEAPGLEDMWEGEQYARKRLKALGAKEPPVQGGQSQGQPQPQPQPQPQAPAPVASRPSAAPKYPAPPPESLPPGFTFDTSTGYYINSKWPSAKYQYDSATNKLKRVK